MSVTQWHRFPLLFLLASACLILSDQFLIAAGPIVDPPLPEPIEISKGAGRGDLIYAPVLLAGRELLFIVDTGASITILDSTLEPELRPTDGQFRINAGSERGLPARAFQPPELSLGRTRLELHSDICTQDLSLFRRMLGKPVMGVLGTDVLRHYCLRFDFEHRRLEFIPSPGRRQTDWGQSFPIEFRELDRPFIRTDLVGYGPVPMMIDTGNSGIGNLSNELFTKATEEGNPMEFSIVARVEGPQRIRRVSIARASTLAGMRLTGLHWQEGERNVLGLEVLSNYMVTLDFPGGGAYLKAIKPEITALPPNQTGVSLQRQGGQTLIYAVDADSPAQRAGLRAGSRIARIDGKTVDDLELWAVRQMLRKPAAHVGLDIDRVGTTQHYTLDIADTPR